MDMNPEIEQARREFLDECDFVLRIPAVCFLKGDRYACMAVVHPVPLYYYYGISIKKGEFCIKKRHIKNNVDVAYGQVKVNDIGSEERLTNDSDEYFEPIKEMERFLIDKFKIKETTIADLKKSEFRIWSEIPENEFMESEFGSLGLAILIYCLDRKITPSMFDAYKKEYKTIGNIVNQGKLFLNMEEAEKRGLNIQKCRIFHEIFKLSWNLASSHNGASYFASLIGMSQTEKILSSIGGEGLVYTIPLPKGVTEQELESFFIIPDEHKDIDILFADYITEIVNENKIETTIIPNLTERDKFIITSWFGEEKGLFGPILSAFCLTGLSEFKLQFGDKNNFLLKEQIMHMNPVNYLLNSLLLKGQDTSVVKAAREIKDSQKGWIHYYSYTLEYEFEGARFLRDEEYKLPKSQKKEVSIPALKSKEEPEAEKAEINFTETEVQISGQEPLSKEYPWEILEQLILQERIHWLWGFVYLSSWTSGGILECLPKKQFGNYISKEIKKKKDLGFDIQHKRNGDEWSINCEITKSRVKCNLLNARGNYKEAVDRFEKGEIADAIKKLESAISLPHYADVNFIDAYNLLTECVLKINFENIRSNLLNKIERFLRWYQRRLREALFVIQKLYIKNGIFSEEDIAYEFNKMKEEFDIAKRRYVAVKDRAPLAESIEEFEELANIIQNLREIMEEKVIEGRIEDVVFETAEFMVFKHNKHLKEIIKMGIEEIGKVKRDLDYQQRISEMDMLLLDIIRKGINFEKCNTLTAVKKFLHYKLKREIWGLVKSSRKTSNEKPGYDLDMIKNSTRGKRKSPNRSKIDYFDEE